MDFEDIKNVIVSVLSHRLRLKPSVKYLQSPSEFIQEQLKRFLDSQGKSFESDLP